jgi:hypothetical protein
VRLSSSAYMSAMLRRLLCARPRRLVASLTRAVSHDATGGCAPAPPRCLPRALGCMAWAVRGSTRACLVSLVWPDALSSGWPCGGRARLAGVRSSPELWNLWVVGAGHPWGSPRLPPLCALSGSAQSHARFRGRRWRRAMRTRRMRSCVRAAARDASGPPNCVCAPLILGCPGPSGSCCSASASSHVLLRLKKSLSCMCGLWLWRGSFHTFFALGVGLSRVGPHISRLTTPCPSAISEQRERILGPERTGPRGRDAKNSRLAPPIMRTWEVVLPSSSVKESTIKSYFWRGALNLTWTDVRSLCRVCL